MGIFIRDLLPRTSNKTVYEGEGQTHYLSDPLDLPGVTTVTGDSYASGSRETSPILDAVADDTTGGGNDVLATPAAEFGLAAYLRERIQPGGVANPNAGRMVAADAVMQAFVISGQVTLGNDITVASLNNILSVAPGSTPNTDLDGAAANSKSFGSVSDILRILSGEIYRCPRFIIVCNLANQFRDEAERDVLVAAQDTATTGRTFISTGGFLTVDEPGFRARPVLIETDALLGSVAAGHLFELKQNSIVLNPAFAYTAADVTPDRPRAVSISNDNILANGGWLGVTVYNSLGVSL